MIFQCEKYVTKCLNNGIENKEILLYNYTNGEVFMYEFKNDYSFTKDMVVRLFKSVDWHSANYPDKLYKALLNYPTVITAYKDGELVGLAATMDDGVMNAYIHYVCVDPKTQGDGVGRRLMEMTNEVYKDYVNVVLISYNNTMKFYEALGYSLSSDSCAMKL